MYIATFYTHFGAVSFSRMLQRCGQAGTMMPVPRALSASCGVCVRFAQMEGLPLEDCDDLTSVYLQGDDGFSLVYTTEEPD